ncbi:YtxH domain-containing protein [Microbacteriaceae bacterium]|nr:YtxH domain-containing protein [Candidatus Saccharibacteria bacterium]
MKSGNKLAIGAIFGAVVGIVAGVLAAPKSGKEARDDIAFKAEEIGDEVVIKATEIIETVKSSIRK